MKKKQRGTRGDAEPMKELGTVVRDLPHDPPGQACKQIVYSPKPGDGNPEDRHHKEGDDGQTQYPGYHVKVRTPRRFNDGVPCNGDHDPDAGIHMEAHPLIVGHEALQHGNLG